MSIQALPKSTTRLIGATQVITNPLSLIKELLDNSLDARATSITIDISTNTLDVLQVRDNGHGVAPEDRDLLCQRYCTSKIREYSDLKDLGGTSLGFRGEALASACEIAGGMSVTTRVDGEEVAVKLEMNQTGEVKSRARASHPAGTTVRVTDLFKALPVRKQTAIKSAPKTLAKIKELCQAYALARPSVRLALKVLKAKNEKGNWTYVPGKEAPKEDAAIKVVGKETAGQCDWAVDELHGFEVQAFLPRGDADSKKIGGVGQFISIDGRPVGTTRGTLKQMVTMFKERLRGASKSLEGVKDPFLWLSISCPTGSYDPNVEPAKDDIVFEDSDKVIEAAGRVFSSYYVPMTRDEEKDEELPASPGVIEVFEDDVTSPAKLPRNTEPANRSMYAGNDDDDDMIMSDHPWVPTACVEDEENSQTGLNDVTINNPWTMAKMNASVKPKRTGSATRNGQLLSPLHERNDIEDNSTSQTQVVPIPPHPPWGMLTPAASSPFRQGTIDTSALLRSDSPLTFQHLARSHEDAVAEGTQEGQDATGHFNVQRDITHRAQDEDDSSIFHSDSPRHIRWRGWDKTNDFTTAAQLPAGTPYSATSLTPAATTQTFLPTPVASTRGPETRKRLRAFAVEEGFESQPPQAEDESLVWFSPARNGGSPAKRRSGGVSQIAGGQGQGQRQGLDIRKAFAAVAASSSAVVAASRANSGSNTKVNAPFRPVVPSWRAEGTLAARMTRGDEEEVENTEEDDEMLDTSPDPQPHFSPGMPYHDNPEDQEGDSERAEAAALEEMQIPSSIAALSTPRRLAVCRDCLYPSSSNVNHTHDHGHQRNVTHNPHDANQHKPLTRAISTKSLGRTKSRTAQLPLERTPLGFAVQNLSIRVRASMIELAKLTAVLKDVEAEVGLDVGAPAWGFPAEGVEEEELDADDDLSTQRASFGGGAQSSLAAPPLTEEEVDSWTTWINHWVADYARGAASRSRSAGPSNEEDDDDEGECNDERAGVFVEEALHAHATKWGFHGTASA